MGRRSTTWASDRGGPGCCCRSTASAWAAAGSAGGVRVVVPQPVGRRVQVAAGAYHCGSSAARGRTRASTTMRRVGHRPDLAVRGKRRVPGRGRRGRSEPGLGGIRGRGGGTVRRRRARPAAARGAGGWIGCVGREADLEHEAGAVEGRHHGVQAHPAGAGLERCQHRPAEPAVRRRRRAGSGRAARRWSRSASPTSSATVSARPGAPQLRQRYLGDMPGCPFMPSTREPRRAAPNRATVDRAERRRPVDGARGRLASAACRTAARSQAAEVLGARTGGWLTR